MAAMPWQVDFAKLRHVLAMWSYLVFLEMFADIRSKLLVLDEERVGKSLIIGQELVEQQVQLLDRNIVLHTKLWSCRCQINAACSFCGTNTNTQDSAWYVPALTPSSDWNCMTTFAGGTMAASSSAFRFLVHRFSVSNIVACPLGSSRPGASFAAAALRQPKRKALSTF